MRKIDFDKETVNHRWATGAIINLLKESAVRVTCSCGVRVWFSESDPHPAIGAFIKDHCQHGTLIAEDMELAYTPKE